MSATTGNSPAVTVLMSCYNSARWLNEAIDSVLRQTFTDFEFIIIDDGSTDESPAIISARAERDPRIVVIRKVNSGLADSLNVGIRHARGKWIARIDADDLCRPQRLARQLELACRHPDCDFVGSGIIEIDENGTLLAVHHYPKDHADLVRNLATMRKFPAHSSAFLRADAVRAVGGYRIRLKRSQDWDLWLRLCEAGHLVAVEAPLVCIRKHAEQISRDDSGRRQRVDARVAVTSYWIRRLGGADPIAGNENTFLSFRAWLEQRMEEKRSFEYLQFVAHFKNTLAMTRRSPWSLFSAAAYLAGNPILAVRFLRTHFFGEQDPCRFAIDWLRKVRSSAYE